MLTFTNNEEINQTEEKLEPNKIKAQGRKQNRSRYQAKQNFSHTKCQYITSIQAINPVKSLISELTKIPSIISNKRIIIDHFKTIMELIHSPKEFLKLSQKKVILMIL